MLVIIGRKIIMHQGDIEAFSILVRDSKGKDVDLLESDKITLRMKYSMESRQDSIIKVAESVTSEDGSVHYIIKFESDDTIDALTGDYLYDVILERDNKRFTIIPKSLLVLEESIFIEEEDDEEEDDELDYDEIISSTPLIGSFPERLIQVQRSQEDEDTEEEQDPEEEEEEVVQ